MGVQDKSLKEFLQVNERYADVVNGFGCGGKQVFSKDDLYDWDTQTGSRGGAEFLCQDAEEDDGEQQSREQRNREKRKREQKKRLGNTKYRDLVRKVSSAMSFIIVGIENQEEIDYLLPLRNMSYDVGEYEKQAAQIKKETRKKADKVEKQDKIENMSGVENKGNEVSRKLSAAEYLCGFRKDSRMFPVVTFILYYGKKPWDGALNLHGLLDFTGVPEELKGMVADYRINLIEIRKLEDTSIFKTDVRLVFDFIRCSDDKGKLRELVENNEDYQNMEEDAFDVAVQYTHAKELIQAKDYYRKEGKIDMCEALTEMLADEREEGREFGRAEGIKMMVKGAIEMCVEFGVSKEDTLKRLQEKFTLSSEEAEEYVRIFF